MNIPVNEPISYDDHGDISLEVPFTDLQPTDISIYLQLNTRVGKDTCRQACAHCFFINQPEAKARSMDLAEGRKVMKNLQALGYKVFPMISDSFGHNGEFLRLYGNSHNRDYRQDADRQLTKTMKRGEAWTSGAPLLDTNWYDLLCCAVENGFGSVTITFHGMLDNDLNVVSHEHYPIKGVFKAQHCETVMRRIGLFNADLQAGKIERMRFLSSEARQPIEINIGVTIGQHNHGRQNLLRYIHYFNKLPVSVVRFNRFHDHGWLHPHLPLNQDETAQFYRDIKWIHTNVPLRFQLGVDEDFGNNGIEVMGFPEHTGVCRAGHQLFAVVPDNTELISEDNNLRLERVGSVAGCVDAFKPIVGRLVRQTNTQTQQYSYYIEFFHDIINELKRKRLSGIYSDGCFANEMLGELHKNDTTGIATQSRSLPVL